MLSVHDWTSFWPDLLAALIGVGIGMALVLRFDRKRESIRRSGEQKVADDERDTRESLFLRNTMWGLEVNMELAQQILSILRPQTRQLPVLAFRLNTHLLDEAILELSRLCDDSTLLWEIENLRYQMLHLNDKLSLMQLVAYRSYRYIEQPIDAIPQQPEEGESNALRATIVEHAELIVSTGDELLPRIRSRLQRFETSTRPFVRPPLKLVSGEESV